MGPATRGRLAARAAAATTPVMLASCYREETSSESVLLTVEAVVGLLIAVALATFAWAALGSDLWRGTGRVDWRSLAIMGVGAVLLGGAQFFVVRSIVSEGAAAPVGALAGAGLGLIAGAAGGSSWLRTRVRRVELARAASAERAQAERRAAELAAAARTAKPKPKTKPARAPAARSRTAPARTVPAKRKPARTVKVGG